MTRGNTGAPVPVRILVAEDDPINRKIVTLMLDTPRYRLTTVASGTEAIASLEGGGFDLLISDISMPGMDGLTMIGIIRELPGENASLPILAMTAHAFASDRQRILDAGANGYIAKPFTPEELQGAIERLLAEGGRP